MRARIAILGSTDRPYFPMSHGGRECFAQLVADNGEAKARRLVERALRKASDRWDEWKAAQTD
jgi:hypothetical protein